MDKKIHIVSFDVPWPANYGGVIDVLYKIKALQPAGVKIVLHCFLYGQREAAPELALYCDQIHYYRRTTGVQGFSMLRPYIVSSRKSTGLLKNLLMDDAPILFEGLHCCYFLNHPSLQNRKKYVRAHNIEHEYYGALAQSEKKWWKRLFFKTESKLLAQYEIILKEAGVVFAIAEKDAHYFSKDYNTKLIPAFHANNAVTTKIGVGDYCLYQGNLAVSENEQALFFLLDRVFAHLDFSLKIAGANPSERLKAKVAEFKNIELIANPTDEKLALLVANAQINVLYAAERSGLKLKLLNAIFQGRHVVANKHILESSSLQSVAHLANTTEEFIDKIKSLQDVEFTIDEIEKRKHLLSEEFSNETNAQKIINTIFS